MKVTVLAENTACREDLRAEHGLSLYIETGDHRILFDMGQTDAFVHNAGILGIDLAGVDIAVVSHGHYDHGGGLRAFLKVNTSAPVYIHKTAFGSHYNGREKYIGLSPDLAAESRLVFTSGSLEIAPGVSVQDCNDLCWDFEPYGLNKKVADRFLPEDFTHEQYLQIREGEKRVLFSGCSHKGITNIADGFKADVMIGGFHLNKVEDRQTLAQTAQQLLATAGTFFTGHCTGQKQFAFLKEIMGDRLGSLSTGTVLNI